MGQVFSVACSNSSSDLTELLSIGVIIRSFRNTIYILSDFLIHFLGFVWFYKQPLHRDPWKGFQTIWMVILKKRSKFSVEILISGSCHIIYSYPDFFSDNIIIHRYFLYGILSPIKSVRVEWKTKIPFSRKFQFVILCCLL